eukprot:g3963.t1
MSRATVFLMLCLTACLTSNAQLDVLEDEEFANAIVEATSSLISVETGETVIPSEPPSEASALSPEIDSAPSVETEPLSSLDDSPAVASEESVEISAPAPDSSSSDTSSSEDELDPEDSIESELDEDSALNTKVLTVVGSCITGLIALVLA